MAEDGAELIDELMRFRPEGITPNAWAVKAGVSRTIWSDLRRHGNPSRRTLSKLLEAAGSSLAEFEALRVGRPAEAVESAGLLAEGGRRWGGAPVSPLPLLWSGSGGMWRPGIGMIAIDDGNVIDRLARPASLSADRTAYAVTVVDESMWPRFRSGRQVAVSPSAPVGIGDDVLLVLADGRGALVGELQSQDGGAIRLRQFNPPAEFDVPAGSVAAVHKVLGELI